jgi:hypothetical protein
MMPEEIDPADLAALEQLLRYGLADVVTIDGEPHYTLGPRFTGTAPSRRLEPETSQGRARGRLKAPTMADCTLAPRSLLEMWEQAEPIASTRATKLGHPNY